MGTKLRDYHLIWKIRRWIFIAVADLLRMGLYVDWEMLVRKREWDRKKGKSC